jgi:hypothetical protein
MGGSGPSPRRFLQSQEYFVTLPERTKDVLPECEHAAQLSKKAIASDSDVNEGPADIASKRNEREKNKREENRGKAVSVYAGMK